MCSVGILVPLPLEAVQAVEEIVIINVELMRVDTDDWT